MAEKYVSCNDLRNALYEADAVTMRGVAIINGFPAADVAPVLHGRWERIYDKPAGGPRLRCSLCRSRSLYAFYYCPDCGAKMDGGHGDG